MHTDSDETRPTDADVVRIAARAYERDRYLSALLAAADVRRDLIALAAFAGEIGRIPAYVSEPMMGRIRLQWWRERIEGGTSGGHPVAAALLAAIDRFALPSARLTALIDAHENTLEDAPFADAAALFAYLQETQGTLFACAGLVHGATVAPELIADAGLAYGLARHLLELPATLAQGRVLLPVDRLLTAGVSIAQLQSGARNAASLKPIVSALAAEAHCHLAAIRLKQHALSRRKRKAFLPLALVEPYLQVSQNVGSIQPADVDVGPLSRVMRLWLAHMTGWV